LPEVPAFDLATHAAYVDAGTARISGQAFMRRRDGAVVTCAGEAVYAYPATAFFQALALHNAAGGRTSMVHGGTAAMNLVRDAQGRFLITGLPRGRWLVSTRVRWMAGDVPQGGTMLQVAQAEIQPKEQVLLTDVDVIGFDRR
jgi:hypothetical protein